MLKPRLEKFYEKVISEDLVLLYNFKTISEIPNFERAVLNSTSNKFVSSKYSVLQSFCAWFLCTGQKGKGTKARKSIALFGIRQNNLLGVKITLRKRSLFSLLDKLLLFVLPKHLSTSEIRTKSQTNFSTPSRDSSRKENTLFLKKNINKTKFVLNKVQENFPQQLPIYFVSQKNSVYFPEVSQLLNFFDSLAGFSLLHSLKISKKSNSQKKDKTTSDFPNYRDLTGKTFEEYLKKKNEFYNGNTFLDNQSNKTKKRKKSLLSALQLPTFDLIE